MISKEHLESKRKSPWSSSAERAKVFHKASAEIVGTIEAHNKAGNATVFIDLLGPVGPYLVFVRLANERKFCLRQWSVNKDEHLDENRRWLHPGNRLCMRVFMQHAVHCRIDPAFLMPESQHVCPDPGQSGEIGRGIVAPGGVVEAMPECCVTVGIKEFPGARRIRLCCPKEWCRAGARWAAHGEKAALFPVTLLQDHPDARNDLTGDVPEHAD